MQTPTSLPLLGLNPRSCSAAPPRRRGVRWRGRGGFTIVEVAFAAIVMAFGITSSIVALGMGFTTIDNARNTTLAGQILQSQMEKLRLLTWAQLTDSVHGAAAHPTFTPDISALASAELGQFTSCTQTIADAPAPFNTSMKDITLTVTWKGLNGRQHSLSYITRYGQNGISDFFYTTH